MSRTLASHPPWTASSATGIAAGPAAALPAPAAHAAARERAFRLARGLEDAVLVVVAALLFPVIILLVFSPLALLVKVLVAGVQAAL